MDLAGIIRVKHIFPLGKCKNLHSVYYINFFYTFHPISEGQFPENILQSFFRIVFLKAAAGND